MAPCSITQRSRSPWPRAGGASLRGPAALHHSYAVAGDSTGTARVDQPCSLGIGVSARPAGKLLSELDYDRVNWSEARSHHPPAVVDLLQLPATTPYPTLKPQDDVEQYRPGGKSPLEARGPVFPVRAGLILDRLMIQDELGVEVIGYGGDFTVL